MDSSTIGTNKQSNPLGRWFERPSARRQKDLNARGSRDDYWLSLEATATMRELHVQKAHDDIYTFGTRVKARLALMALPWDLQSRASKQGDLEDKPEPLI